MSCIDDDWLARLLQGALSSDEYRRVDQHTEHCQSCRMLLDAVIRARSTDPTPVEQELTAAAAGALPVQTSPAMPQVSPRYVIESLIGQGGMGQVYCALDRLTQQRVALKRVFAPPSWEARTGVAARRAALAQEFRILMSIRHPNVLRVFDYAFDSEREPYIVMELLAAAQPVVPFSVHLSRAEQLGLIGQMLRALSYLHRRKILHRDLKPSNVLVVAGSEGPTVKLLDFGLSIDQTEMPHPRRAGTLAYMAPELFCGSSPSEASDLYAVGVIAVQILTGSLPFDLASNPVHAIRQVLTQEPDLSSLPAELRSVLAPTLCKQPHQRPADAATLLRSLAQAAGLSLQSEPLATWNSYLVSAKFTGRQIELRQLREALGAAAEQRGSAWLLGGESGVGKSRLLDELHCQALLDGTLVVSSQAYPEGGSAYRLWQGVLRSLVLHVDLSDVEVSYLAMVLPELRTLLGRNIAPPADVEVQPLQSRTLHILRDVLLRCQRPVLMLLEDLQWADEDSLTLLNQVAQGVSAVPLMIVASYRDDEAHILATRLQTLQVLRLERLSRGCIEQLCESMLGAQGRSPQLLDRVEQVTEGNALFIVELMRSLIEASGSMDAVRSDASAIVAIPSGIKQVFQRRLSRVPAEAWSLLRLAAVSGRELDEHILATLEPYLDARIQSCAEVGILELHAQRWRFSHDQLREYVLADIPDAVRATCHARVAQSIEAIDPTGSMHAARMAYHFREANDAQRAAYYYARAGEDLLSRGAPAEAETLLMQALTLHPALGWSQLEKLRLWRALTQVRFALGQLAATDAALREVCALQGTPLPSDPRSWLAAMARELGTQLSHRLGWTRRMAPHESRQAPRAGDKELLGALTVQEIYVWLGRPEQALLCTLWGLNLAEAAGEPARRSGFAAAWMFLLSYTPLRRLAIGWLQAPRAAQTQTASDEISRLRVLAICWLNEGQWRLAADCAAQAVSLARLQRDDLSLMSCLLPLQLARTSLDEYGPVLSICQELEKLASQVHHPRYTALALIGQAVSWLRTGDFVEADAALQRALEQAELGDLPEAVALSLTALVSLRTGQRTRAYDCADAAMQRVRRVRWPSAELRYALSCVLDVYLASADLSRHQAVIEEALAGLRQIALRFPFVAPSTALYRARYAWRQGQHDSAEALFRRSMQGSSQRGARFEHAWAACWTGQFLTQVGSTTQRRLGQTYLREALTVFTSLGNAWDADQARAHLQPPSAVEARRQAAT